MNEIEEVIFEFFLNELWEGDNYDDAWAFHIAHRSLEGRIFRLLLSIQSL